MSVEDWRLSCGFRYIDHMQFRAAPRCWVDDAIFTVPVVLSPVHTAKTQRKTTHQAVRRLACSKRMDPAFCLYSVPQIHGYYLKA